MELIIAGILLFVIVWWIMDGILKATGWDNAEDRRKAKTMIAASVFLRGKK